MFSTLSIRKWAQGKLGQFVVYFLTICINVSYAALPSSANQSTQFTHPFDAQEATSSQISNDALALDNSMLGWASPFSLGVDYSSLDKTSVNAQYTKKFNSQFAASILGEYGADVYRYGATLGAKFFENGFAKLSAEQFSQKLPFDFASGEVDKFVKQNAVGARYQQNFQMPLLRNLNGGVYYSHALNRSLDPVTFDLNGATAINYRNIAGGSTGGGDIGSALHLTPTTEVSAQLYYDYLRYDTEFTDDSEDDAQGLGGGLGLKQLLSPHFALAGMASVREIYNTYTAELAWLLPSLPGAELSVAGQTVVSQNDTPDNNSISLVFGYNFGHGGLGSRYALSPLSTTQDVGQWTNTPAVYMEQVLAVSEEYTEIVGTKSAEDISRESAATSSIEPASGPLRGAQGIIITGTNFVAPVSVTFDNVAAKNIVINSPTQLTVDAPAHAAGPVTVKIISGTGTKQITTAEYTYQTAPTITKLSHTTGTSDTLVTIDGENFTGATHVMFGEAEGAELNVINTNQITVKAPAQHQDNSVHVIVTTPSGSSIASTKNIFSYVKTCGTPSVSYLDQVSGPTSGNQDIIIHGSNLTCFPSNPVVTFGGKPALLVSSAGDGSSINIRSPANSDAPQNVTVTVNNGTHTGTFASSYNYLPPTISMIDPTSGPSCTGGTLVTITGTEFENGQFQPAIASVTFDGVSLTPVNVISDTELTVTTQADGAGFVDIVITDTSGATASRINGFEFTGSCSSSSDSEDDVMEDVVIGSLGVLAATSLLRSQFNHEAITPETGSPNGGDKVTIEGENFVAGKTKVYFGGRAATSVKVIDEYTLTATTPPGRGVVDVEIKTPNENEVIEEGFEYQ